LIFLPAAFVALSEGLKMRKPLVAFACLAILASPLGAQTSSPGSTPGSTEKKSEAPSTKTHRITGTITAVDETAKTVTLDHGAVKSLNWPAMKMTFAIDQKVATSKLKPGAKVDVDVVQRGKGYVVIAVR
jgi:Cu/Ag efflux protein CusF